ncbi:MAG: excinuclease ABC subunit UvrC [Thermoanaerobaculia bacterium]|nr:excinuclease ABC subunit UvrC [Thermoanaerobaculia bacterium]
MAVSEALAQRIRELPDQPGIYLFRDASGALLYVGKAKSLRKRAASYLGEGQEARIATMLAEAARIDFVLTDSESEALLLENNWIKNKNPRYNILLRDDKTYPYVKLTLRDDYPRIAFTRRLADDGAEYFGPYLPAGLARKAINLVQKLFEIRVCTIDIDGSLARPCLYYDLDRCLGPCVDGLTTRPDYDEAVRQARLFLGGRNDELVRELEGAMHAASEALEFERAAHYRDMISQIEAIGQRRKLVSTRGEDIDIYGVYTAGGNAAVVALVMRGGQILDRRELFFEGRRTVGPAAVLSEVLPQVYDRTSFIPKELHLPLEIEGAEALEEWLSQTRGNRVYVRLPARGPKAHRIELAQRNARLAFQRRFRHDGAADRAATALAETLELAEPPQRIEGIDISNLQGSEMVGSLVVWEGGRMNKSEYRSFNLRGMVQPDDVAAVRQVVERRYRRRLEELGAMPDLILIDGGRGQLNAALEALAELGVEETPVVALAKRQEEIYRVAHPAPLRLERRDPGLRLLQQIRDEAHRFALRRHRGRRRRATLTSRLDEVPGIGPKRRRKLLEHFGSLEGVRSADRAELREVLGPKLAERVHSWLAADSVTATDPGAR